MSGELPDLPDVGGADLPAGDTESYASDLAAELEASRDEPDDSGDDEPGYGRDIREAMQGAEDDPEAAWRRELSEFVKPHRDALNALGKGKKHAIRALFRAEERLRSDPAGGVAWLAGHYAQQLPPEQKARLAVQTLQALGYEHAGAIGQHERAELEQYRQQAQALAAKMQADEQRALAQIEQFSRTAPHFERLRPTMAALFEAGRVSDLQAAYDLAAKIEGLGPPPAQATTMAPRDAIARARAARTPKTASVPVPVADDDEDLPQPELLRKLMRAANGAGRRA